LHTGAWAIGGDALRAVYNAELTVGPPTTLTTIALDVFGEATVEGLLHSFTRRGGRAAWDAALLAPSVLRLARAGDSVAMELLRDHGTRLGTMARVAVSKVELEAPFPLVLLGGLLRGEGSELIVEEIVSRLPEAVPVRPGYEPVAGALLLALDHGGVGYDPRLVETTMPRGHIYDTVRSRRVP
jgi:N-acetylglucosamine kinase-like BadF-type ATPase